MSLFLSIGECMVELSASQGDLWQLGIAGDTLNTAWYARAALPAEWDVGYVTRLGSDAFSDRAAEFIEAHGIGLPFVPRHPSRSIGLYAISLSQGERSFTYWRDASAARTLMDARASVEAVVAMADALHVSGISLAILPPDGRTWLMGLMRAVRARGGTSSFDPNYRSRLWNDMGTARENIAAAARQASVVLPSFEDDTALFGDASPEDSAKRYAQLGAELVIVKDGGKGVTIAERGKHVARIDLVPVHPVDTTGAGDSFDGAFLAAILTGKASVEAVRLAHAVASHVVLHRGALVSLPMDGPSQAHP